MGKQNIEIKQMREHMNAIAQTYEQEQSLLKSVKDAELTLEMQKHAQRVGELQLRLGGVQKEQEEVQIEALQNQITSQRHAFTQGAASRNNSPADPFAYPPELGDQSVPIPIPPPTFVAEGTRNPNARRKKTEKTAVKNRKPGGSTATLLGALPRPPTFQDSTQFDEAWTNTESPVSPGSPGAHPKEGSLEWLLKHFSRSNSSTFFTISSDQTTEQASACVACAVQSVGESILRWQAGKSGLTFDEVKSAQARQDCAAAVWSLFPRMRRDSTSQLTFPSNKTALLRQMKGRAYRDAMDSSIDTQIQTRGNGGGFGAAATMDSGLEFLLKATMQKTAASPIMRLEFERGLPLLLGIKMSWVLFDGTFRKADTSNDGTLTLNEFVQAFGSYDPASNGDPLYDQRSPSTAGSAARASVKVLCGGLELSGMNVDTAMESVDVGGKKKLSLAELIQLFRILNVQPPRKHAHALLTNGPGRTDKFIAIHAIRSMVQSAYDDAGKHIQDRIDKTSENDNDKSKVLKKRRQQLSKAKSAVLGVALEDWGDGLDTANYEKNEFSQSTTRRPQAGAQDVQVLEEFVELLSDERKAKDEAIDEMVLYAKRLKTLVSNQGHNVERSAIAEKAAQKSLAQMKSRAISLLHKVSNNNPGTDVRKESLRSEASRVTLRKRSSRAKSGGRSLASSTSNKQESDAQIGLLLSFVEQLETDISDKDRQALALTKRVVKLVNVLSKANR